GATAAARSRRTWGSRRRAAATRRGPGRAGRASPATPERGRRAAPPGPAAAAAVCAEAPADWGWSTRGRWRSSPRWSSPLLTHDPEHVRHDKAETDHQEDHRERRAEPHPAGLADD